MATTFAYKVRDQSGKLVEGQLDADDASTRRRQAPADGLHAHRRRGEDQQQDEGRRQDPRHAPDRVKIKDVAVFSRQFAMMINSGLSLIRSLAILAEQTENAELAGIARRGSARRREGRLALRRDRQAPESVQPALHRDGAFR